VYRVVSPQNGRKWVDSPHLIAIIDTCLNL
jgi:hypothetical protein